ncbi:hypothetical protein, partial [Shewanella colwelliana]|uniref:hypothetical protein n=1 Tax=Shewanella colwelliana TaxID=23 RepID=UPI001C7DDCBA
EECADTAATRRESIRGGSTMASLPSTSAAASAPSFLPLRFDLVRSFWTKISWPSNEGVGIFWLITFDEVVFIY